MSHLDETPEGDESIRQIAEELNRIKRVAELLRNAESSIDAVLSASEDVIDKAGDFAANSTKILQRLADVDLDDRFTQIQTAVSDARTSLANAESKLSSALEELSESHGTGVSEVKSQLTALSLSQSEMRDGTAAGVDRLSQELKNLGKSLDASLQKLEQSQDVHFTSTIETLVATRKQLLIAVGTSIVLVVMIIVLLLLA